MRARAAVVVGALAFTGVAGAAAPLRAEPGGCGWSTAGSGGPTAPVMHEVFPEADGVHVNTLYGEMDAHYWQSYERIPTGGHIEYHGQFPHARYMSFTNYGGGIRSVDGIYDAAIVPDPGSSNPFLPGGDRLAEPRWFTVRFVDGQAPPAGERAPNAFYRINEDGSNNSNRLAPTVSLRIYTADRGAGPAGGVPLPRITIVDADGNRTELPACPEGGLPSLGTDESAANAGTGEPMPAVDAVDPVAGDNPPVWRKFTGYGSAATGGSGATGEGGFGDNRDQTYIHTTFDKTVGEVLVFRAKAPTFVPTWDDVPVMGEGQLRFWTMCTYAPTTSGYDCRRDETVPLDGDGYYTYAISTAASRPANAVDRCGVAWLPAGPTTEARVIFRNLLPDPGFAEAIHNVEFGREVEMMGEYYPHGAYYTRSAFEQLGCREPAAPAWRPGDGRPDWAGRKT
jgi:hypothetical protein